MKTEIYKRPKIFFDFDNTITTFDVLDSVVERFSEDGTWKVLEKRWKTGEIGSRECLKGQVEGIRVSKRDLDRHLERVKIDPYFKPILNLLRSKKIKTVIVSDNFDYILKRILKKNGIDGLDIYSNRLTFSKDRLIPGFPFSNDSCGDCGNCKENVLLAQLGSRTRAFYIGDGLSDRCASKAADVVFAKGSLKRYLKEDGVPYIPFDNLKDVYKHLKETL